MRYTTRIIVPPKIRRSGQPGSKEARYAPQVIGVRKSFGFGDLLGLAAPGQVRAASAYRDWTPFFAQQSVEELAMTERSPQDVLRASVRGLEGAGFRHPWGADADRLTTPVEVENAAGAGFTYFTIDPSTYLRRDADTLPLDVVEREIGLLVEDGDLPENWSESYLGRFIDLPGDWRLELTREQLLRAALKFGRAIQHCARMYEAVARASHGRPFEIEACLDGTPLPATPLEHLFAGLELEARQVRLTSLGLHFAGMSPAGAGLDVTPAVFEEKLRGHMAVAQFCGPYKLSFRGGPEHFDRYPIIGRLCGEQLHVKTSGTSYLEALRAVLRIDPDLFAEIVDASRAGQGRTVVVSESASLGEVEATWLDSPVGQRMLLAACGSVLKSGRAKDGRNFREAITETVNLRPELHEEFVAACYDKHLRCLNAG